MSDLPIISCKECKQDKAAYRRGTRYCRRCYLVRYGAGIVRTEKKTPRKRGINTEPAKYGETRKEVWQSRMQANIEFALQQKSLPCTDCGNSYHPVAMDFDHVRGIKLGEIAAMIRNVSFDKLKAEIDKCEIVCAVCHRIRSHLRKHADGKILPYSIYNSYSSIKKE